MAVPETGASKGLEPERAAHHSADKPRMELLPNRALRGVADVLTWAAKHKYDADNWRKGTNWREYIGSLRRHLADYIDGKDYDEESGLPVIDHVCCCALFLGEYWRTHREFDDRYKLAAIVAEAKGGE